MNISEFNFRMFEIYAKEYKKSKIEKSTEKSKKLEGKMLGISEELTMYIIEICNLDLEFKQNSREIPDHIKYYIENKIMLNTTEYVKNTKWDGFWKKCSGKDLEYFVSYLQYPIIYGSDEIYIDNKKNLIQLYKYNTGTDKVPYGVFCAQYLNEKYFK